MTDTWREIGDGYAVSIDGRVRGSRGWVLTPRRHTSGYLIAVGTHREIAQAFGISREHVGHIRSGKARAHVT